MAESEQRKLDSQHVADRRFHGCFTPSGKTDASSRSARVQRRRPKAARSALQNIQRKPRIWLLRFLGRPVECCSSNSQKSGPERDQCLPCNLFPATVPARGVSTLWSLVRALPGCTCCTGCG